MSKAAEKRQAKFEAELAEKKYVMVWKKFEYGMYNQKGTWAVGTLLLNEAERLEELRMDPEAVIYELGAPMDNPFNTENK